MAGQLSMRPSRCRPRRGEKQKLAEFPRPRNGPRKFSLGFRLDSAWIPRMTSFWEFLGGASAGFWTRWWAYLEQSALAGRGCSFPLTCSHSRPAPDTQNITACLAYGLPARRFYSVPATTKWAYGMPARRSYSAPATRVGLRFACP